jgi:hypothetical protein
MSDSLKKRLKTKQVEAHNPFTDFGARAVNKLFHEAHDRIIDLEIEIELLKGAAVDKQTIWGCIKGYWNCYNHRHAWVDWFEPVGEWNCLTKLGIKCSHCGRKVIRDYMPRS